MPPTVPKLPVGGHRGAEGDEYEHKGGGTTMKDRVAARRRASLGAMVASGRAGGRLSPQG